MAQSGLFISKEGKDYDFTKAFCTHSDAFISEDISSRKLFKGEVFHTFVETTVTSGSSVYFAFQIGSNAVLANFVSIALGDGLLTIECFEEADVSGGTPVSLYNMNRESSNTCDVTILNAPTVNTEGTKIDKIAIGSIAGTNGSTTSILNAQLPWRLKPNTTYLVKFTNNDSSDIDIITRITIIND